MERQTDLAEAVDTVADGARYDNCAKKLLAFKAIDAWILKYCTKEFSFYSIEYIMKHCMTGVKRRFAIRTGDGLKSPEIRMAATLLQTRDARTPAVTTLCRCLA